MNPIQINLSRPNNWQDMVSNLSEWKDWDRAWRRKLGWRSGLQFWGKTNVHRSRLLLSRHWPHRLCWSWCVWVGVRRHDEPRRFFVNVARKYRSITIQVWSIYTLFTWQDYDWMAGRLARETAPTIYWKHHLEHATPAGTA